MFKVAATCVFGSGNCTFDVKGATREDLLTNAQREAKKQRSRLVYLKPSVFDRTVLWEGGKWSANSADILAQCVDYNSPHSLPDFIRGTQSQGMIVDGVP